ncbi:hypothetical protein ACFQ38_12040 [Sporosarcina contaminans]|uniref:Uncharacterized protein n=1 Tax=Sporosarcina contaminans TaxID=633403 RepID=A0ABW3TYB0_9BACL
MNLKSDVEANKLIDHLEGVLAEENRNLTNIAIQAMESNPDAPFRELSLIDYQKEYKLKQQRVLGIIDTIEEVKAFLEGYFDRHPQTEVEVK